MPTGDNMNNKSFENLVANFLGSWTQVSNCNIFHQVENSNYIPEKGSSACVFYDKLFVILCKL